MGPNWIRINTTSVPLKYQLKNTKAKRLKQKQPQKFYQLFNKTELQIG